MQCAESPLDGKEIKPVNPKGNQLWIFIERIDTEAPFLWPPDAKGWLIGKDPYAGKDWGRRRRQQQRMKLLDGIIDSMDISLNNLEEIVRNREALRAAVHGVAKNWILFRDWLGLSDWVFPGSSDGEAPVCNAGDLGLIPGLGRSPGEGKGYPLQYSCLGNLMGRGTEGGSPWGCKELDTTEWQRAHTQI